ncbi:HAD family hydrolase [Thermosulfuriphilus sp.]
MKRPEVLTFDCYGTLIDWERGILEALRPFLQAGSPSEEEILALYARIEAEEERRFRPYKEILRSVARRIAQELGFSPEEEFDEIFIASLPHWPPFSDIPLLKEFKAEGFRLAIISNTDEDLLAASVAKMGIHFDWLITAEEAKCYKPGRDIFLMAMDKIGLPQNLLLHVAQSHYHDLLPAKDLGIKTVWLNRRAGRSPYGATPPAQGEPDFICRNLYELSDLLKNHC